MLSAEKSANDSAQSPAWRRKPSPATRRASDSRSERASPAKTSGGWRRSSASAASSAAASGQSGCCSAAERRASSSGSQSETGSQHGVQRGSEVRAGGALAPTALDRAALAHLLELLLRLRLLGEQGGLDPVEEPLEPADELGLRDAQLRLASASRS